MAETTRDERTERATAKRRADERRKGNVPNSREVQSLAVLACVVGVFWGFGPAMFSHLEDLVRVPLVAMGSRDLNVQSLAHLGWRLAPLIVAVVGPVFAASMLAGAGASVGQTGWIFTTHKLKFDIKRLNPLSGLKKLFGMSSFVEFAKTLPKVLLVGYVVYKAVLRESPAMMLSGALMPEDYLPVLAGAAWRITYWSLGVLILIALADLIAQRAMWERNHRMTKQEVKDERKQMEGDPKIKARIRALQREAARKRMMADVPLADVVVTNPTHYAVALQWRDGEMRAPKVVAKGRGFVAQRIREVADAAGVPRVENPPLARSLYKQVELGKEIPPPLYKAVAEVLAFVYRLPRRRRRVAAEVSANG